VREVPDLLKCHCDSMTVYKLIDAKHETAFWWMTALSVDRH
jgi:hypothetical protein